MDKKENSDKAANSSLAVKILLFGVLPVMTAIILVAGTLFVAGAIPVQGNNTEIAADNSEDEFGEATDTEEDEFLPAIYTPLDPAFVVNFEGQNQARFLQVTVEVMTRDPAIPDLVQLHMPAIRNNLILLFSDQTYENINTLDGKETLREEALDVVQTTLEEESAEPGIEAVYFTSFVMQ